MKTSEILRFAAENTLWRGEGSALSRRGNAMHTFSCNAVLFAYQEHDDISSDDACSAALFYQGVYGMPSSPSQAFGPMRPSQCLRTQALRYAHLHAAAMLAEEMGK